GPGDKLVLTGAAATNITHTFTSASAGSVNIDGALINYTGLEPITDNLAAVNRSFVYTAGSEAISLVGALSNTIASTLGESVPFSNPTASLSIDAGTGDDTVTVTSVAVGFNASVTIDGGTGDDTVNLNSDLTLAAGRNLNVDLQDDAPTPGTDQITVGAGANLVLSGAGAATLKASRYIALDTGASVEVVDGNLTVEANHQLTPTSGDFIGVILNAAAVLRSTGTGIVGVKGKGGDATIVDQIGVLVSGIISGGSTGTCVVAGTGGAGGDQVNIGVSVIGGSIGSLGANVDVTGQGDGAANTFSNYGVL